VVGLRAQARPTVTGRQHAAQMKLEVLAGTYGLVTG